MGDDPGEVLAHEGTPGWRRSLFGMTPAADRRKDSRRLTGAASVPASRVGGPLAALEDSVNKNVARKCAKALGLPTAQ
jgi:hypothetical protein